MIRVDILSTNAAKVLKNVFPPFHDRKSVFESIIFDTKKTLQLNIHILLECSLEHATICYQQYQLIRFKSENDSALKDDLWIEIGLV